MISRPLSQPLAQGFGAQAILADVSIWRKKQQIDNNISVLETGHFLKGSGVGCG